MEKKVEVKWIKCPRCELNLMNIGHEFCDLCLAELGLNPIQELETTELIWDRSSHDFFNKISDKIDSTAKYNKDIPTKEFIVDLVSQATGVKFYNLDGKRCFFQTFTNKIAYDNPFENDFLIYTPESKMHSTGKYWIDYREIAIKEFMNYKNAIIVIRLDRRKIAVFSLRKLLSYLHAENIMYNYAEGYHWKTFIKKDVLTVGKGLPIPFVDDNNKEKVYIKLLNEKEYRIKIYNADEIEEVANAIINAFNE